MADEKHDPRDGHGRRPLWTELFRGFQIALDPKKLALAAAGILTMAAGWWLIGAIFFNSRPSPPNWPSEYPTADYMPKQTAEGQDSEKIALDRAWKQFKTDRRQWNLLNEAAGREPLLQDAGDLAQTPAQYEELKKQIDAGKTQLTLDGGKTSFTQSVKPYGAMRTMPWFEDRGPNPYMLISGETIDSRLVHPGNDNVNRAVGQSWVVIKKQLKVLLEPLVKFINPVLFLLQPRIGFWNWLYFSLALVWMLAAWALFGGAITRMAAVQVARKDKISVMEAIRFTLSRYLSFFSAPLLPLLAVLAVTLGLIVYGFLHMIPLVGDVIIDGLGWPLVILAGIIMAVILVGLVGWPMMYATISAEGSDSFDALSRSYSYVYQSAWHYLWYAVVALAYGAVLVFFVAFMGSFMVYLGKWAVGQTPWIESTNRDPSYLFVYAPPSYDWRTLLLDGGQAPDGQPLVVDNVVNESAVAVYMSSFHGWNTVGAIMVAFWLWAAFLLMIGFGYSYFWTAGTIIYLLMRRNVDDTDMDEVYLEADESEEVYSSPTPAPTAAAPVSATLTMVEAPTLRAAASATPTATKVETAAPPGDGNPTPAGGAS